MSQIGVPPKDFQRQPASSSPSGVGWHARSFPGEPPYPETHLVRSQEGLHPEAHAADERPLPGRTAKSQCPPRMNQELLYEASHTAAMCATAYRTLLPHGLLCPSHFARWAKRNPLQFPEENPGLELFPIPRLQVIIGSEGPSILGPATALTPPPQKLRTPSWVVTVLVLGRWG
jgi:hypothetical protein